MKKDCHARENGHLGFCVMVDSRPTPSWGQALREDDSWMMLI